MLFINTIYKIIEKFNKLDKNIKISVGLGFLIIILLIATNILKQLVNDDKFSWNYKEIVSAEQILSEGIEVTDRNLYWQFKDIIYKFIATGEDISFDSTETEGEKVDTLEYYDVLSKKYKKYLNKKGYDLVSSTFINKFLIEDHLGYKYVDDFTIEAIYKYDKTKYLCVLQPKSQEIKAYIGIEIDEVESRFAIFYIE